MSAHARGKDAEQGNWEDGKAKNYVHRNKAPEHGNNETKQHLRYVLPAQIGRVVSVIKTVGGA